VRSMVQQRECLHVAARLAKSPVQHGDSAKEDLLNEGSTAALAACMGSQLVNHHCGTVGDCPNLTAAHIRGRTLRP
jgi:hypothetical protein